MRHAPTAFSARSIVPSTVPGLGLHVDGGESDGVSGPAGAAVVLPGEPIRADV